MMMSPFLVGCLQLTLRFNTKYIRFTEHVENLNISHDPIVSNKLQLINRTKEYCLQ